jgi:hypothetical protein
MKRLSKDVTPASTLSRFMESFRITLEEVGGEIGTSMSKYEVPPACEGRLTSVTKDGEMMYVEDIVKELQYLQARIEIIEEMTMMWLSIPPEEIP